jgi:hypothetical protein
VPNETPEQAIATLLIKLTELFVKLEASGVIHREDLRRIVDGAANDRGKSADNSGMDRG